MSSPPFFLRDSRVSKTQTRVKITALEKRRHGAGIFSRGMIFRVSLALLSLRKNGGPLVVYGKRSRVFILLGQIITDD